MPRTFLAFRSARCATSGTNTPTAGCRLHRRGLVSISAPRQPRKLPAGQSAGVLTRTRRLQPRIVRRVRPAENMDGVAGLQVVSGESEIGVEHKIKCRDSAGDVKSPDRKTFHRARPLSVPAL